jgi:hypothetical protein
MMLDRRVERNSEVQQESELMRTLFALSFADERFRGRGGVFCLVDEQMLTYQAAVPRQASDSVTLRRNSQ